MPDALARLIPAPLDRGKIATSCPQASGGEMMSISGEGEPASTTQQGHCRRWPKRKPPKTTYDLFISHSSQDDAYVRELQQSLSAPRPFASASIRVTSVRATRSIPPSERRSTNRPPSPCWSVRLPCNRNGSARKSATLSHCKRSEARKSSQSSLCHSTAPSSAFSSRIPHRAVSHTRQQRRRRRRGRGRSDSGSTGTAKAPRRRIRSPARRQSPRGPRSRAHRPEVRRERRQEASLGPRPARLRARDAGSASSPHRAILAVRGTHRPDRGGGASLVPGEVRNLAQRLLQGPGAKGRGKPPHRSQKWP